MSHSYPLGQNEKLDSRVKEAISVYEGVSLAFKAGLLQAVSP
jgi:hypothetical protein